MSFFLRYINFIIPSIIFIGIGSYCFIQNNRIEHLGKKIKLQENECNIDKSKLKGEIFLNKQKLIMCEEELRANRPVSLTDGNGTIVF